VFGELGYGYLSCGNGAYASKLPQTEEIHYQPDHKAYQPDPKETEKAGGLNVEARPAGLRVLLATSHPPNDFLCYLIDSR
jgi:hypothetical protein